LRDILAKTINEARSSGQNMLSTCRNVVQDYAYAERGTSGSRQTRHGRGIALRVLVTVWGFASVRFHKC
jgi:hypothetical protein